MTAGLLIASLGCLPTVLEAAEARFTLPSAVQPGDLDLTLTKQWRDSVPQDVDAFQLRRTLGMSVEGNPWSFSAPAGEKPVEFRYLLVFKKPLAIGAMDVVMNDAQGSRDLKACALRADVDEAPDPFNERQWLAIKPEQVFEPGFKTRALLLGERRQHSRSSLAHWMLLKPRLASLTPQAVGIAERAPFGSHPNSIPEGRSWVNTERDPNPGAPKQYLRGPVSAAQPSWYILSWEQLQALTGVLLQSNADKFQLYAYEGDPRRNPGLASSDDWRKIESTVQHQSSGGNNNDVPTRFVAFEPLKTLALKLEMTSCNKSPVARIDRFAALTDLQQEPAPTAAGKTPEPFTIRYEQPQDGTLAMVITDLEGRTIRNLVAQVDRRKGPHVEAWDLKDEEGRTVPPGDYRWKSISGPPVELRYQMTPYPNAPMHFPGQTPWLTGESNGNGWMADHATNTSGTTLGDRVYFGAPGVEGGVCFIECDLNGRKQWAKHDFGPFTGLQRLAADAKSVYIHERDVLARMNPETHEIKELGPLSSSSRQGTLTGMAAHDGKVYLSFQMPVPYLDNATRADVVDLEQSLPRYPDRIPDVLGTRRVQPNPRVEFLRLLRLADTPPGQGESPPNKREPHFPIFLESVGDDPREQHIVVAFREPVPLGSVVFPCPRGEFQFDLSVLKPGAKLPANPRAKDDWIAFPAKASAGWICLAAPPKTMTNALRIRVIKSNVDAPDALDTLLTEGKPGTRDPDLDGLNDKNPPGGKRNPAGGPAKSTGWFARIEGMKLLRRRFSGLTPDRVQVSSGTINPAGEWDAARTNALSADDPAIYAMEWDAPQKIAGMAIKEIDGEQTEIDVWTGPKEGEISLADSKHWEHVATYRQARRDSYEPAFSRNDCARYLDGYVDFHRQLETRAVRLRVVKQWADLGDRGTASQRRDRGARSLDPRRCRIWGVTALEYLGGEPPVDTRAYQRLETRDGITGAVLKESPVAIDSGLCVSPAGDLFGIRERQIVKIDPQTGEAEPVLPAIDAKSLSAHRFTIGPRGDFFVYTLPDKVIHAYSAAGKELRTIGHPGGARPGPWDPQKFLEVNELFVDRADGLWVVESQYVPRRIVQYKTDGTLVKELLGNTNYGGGGVLDRHDKSRFYFHHVEFSLDWKTGESKIKGLMAEWMPSDCVPIRANNRTYLATTPLLDQPTQPAAVVYLYDEETGTVRLTAAFGEANGFDALKTGPLQAQLAAGKVLADYTFLWADRNGDGKVDVDEVEFEAKPENQSLRLGRLNRDMRCCAGKTMYQVGEYLANGTPVYEKATLNVPAVYELNDGKLLALHAASDQPVREGNGRAQQNAVSTSKGEKLWSYRTEHNGVSGLWLPPWAPGYVTNEFGVIGHETATAGDLGEFFVVHANNGQWKIWTADGLLAGAILEHKFSPKARSISSFPSAEREMLLTGLSAEQEHFHGYFTKTDSDGRYYIVQGGNYSSVIEVRGLENFRRQEGTLTVTPEDVRRVHESETQQARREVKSLAKSVECLPATDKEIHEIGEIDGVHFGMGYDDKLLYLRWSAEGQGPLRNTGADFHRYFKTGACLDLQLGTDPEANPARQNPAAGDLRLLLTMVDGKPQAVLYQPVVARAAKEEGWTTSTPAGGETTFDRVVRLTDVKMSLATPSSTSYVLTATVPLRTLGLKIEDGMRLSMDWGVLSTDDGFTVKRRRYWSNQLANGTTDEALEARLQPHLWGSVAFVSRSAEERRLTDTVKEINDKPKSTKGAKDLLDDLDRKPK